MANGQFVNDKGIPVVYLDAESAAKKAFLTLADSIATAADGSLEALAGSRS